VDDQRRRLAVACTVLPLLLQVVLRLVRLVLSLHWWPCHRISSFEDIKSHEKHLVARRIDLRSNHELDDKWNGNGSGGTLGTMGIGVSSRRCRKGFHGIRQETITLRLDDGMEQGSVFPHEISRSRSDHRCPFASDQQVLCLSSYRIVC